MSSIEINDIIHDRIATIAREEDKTQEQVISHAISDYTQVRSNSISLKKSKYEPDEILVDKYDGRTKIMIKRILIDEKTSKRFVSYIKNTGPDGVRIASEYFISKHFESTGDNL